MKVVSMCLSRQYASKDMQLGSSRDLDLTRALLGLVRTLPSAGGGGRIGPPSISETNRRRGKIQTAMERPGRDLSDKV